MITRNHVSLTTLSKILMTRKDHNYIPVPLILDIHNLPPGFIYFESDKILSETIPITNDIVTIFYKIGDTEITASNLSTLVKFEMMDNTHLKIDCDFRPEKNEEQFSEIRFGKTCLVHDDFVKASYHLISIEEIPEEKYLPFLPPFSRKPKTNPKNVTFKN
jgi:hypothetical protein